MLYLNNMHLKITAFISVKAQSYKLCKIEHLQVESAKNKTDKLNVIKINLLKKLTKQNTFAPI